MGREEGDIQARTLWGVGGSSHGADRGKWGMKLMKAR
jgi:hypothetical protein